MNILNRGRCSRCIASEKRVGLFWKKDEKVPDSPIFSSKLVKWLFCLKYKKFCVTVAGFVCKEPPMGISACDYNKILNEVK
jgi:hypothetical protein